MEKKIKKLIKNPSIRKFVGVIMIIVGLVFMILPIVPGAWLFFVGLEFLGIRMLLQNKITKKCGGYQLCQKLARVKARIFNN